MKIMNLTLRLMCLSALTSIMAGCIKEDLSDCPPAGPENNVKIDFRLFEGGIFTDNITSVIAVLFDGEGTYVPPAFTLDEAALNRYAGLEMTLAPGDYRMVFWANVGNNTEIKVVDGTPIVTYKDAIGVDGVVGNGDRVWYAPVVAATRADVNPEPLEYYTFTVTGDGNFNDAVDFTKTHNSVNIYIRGLPSDPDSMPIIEITNLPSAAEFYGMDPLTDPLPTVTSSVKAVTTEVNDISHALATFHTSPLGDMAGMYIVIKDAGGNELYRIPLADAVVQSGSNPGDYQIDILFSFTEIDGPVVIMDWDEEGLGKDF